MPIFEPEKWNDKKAEEKAIQLLKKHEESTHKLMALVETPNANAIVVLSHFLRRFDDKTISAMSSIDEKDVAKLRTDFNNDIGTQYSANCYSYAVNDSHNFKGEKPEPGIKSGMNAPVASDFTAEGIIARAEKDGLKLVSDGKKLPDKHERSPNTYLVALYVNEGHDYHWMRQDKDGSWSQKEGYGSVKKVESQYFAGIELVGYKRVGYFEVPEKGLDVGENASPSHSGQHAKQPPSSVKSRNTPISL